MQNMELIQYTQLSTRPAALLLMVVKMSNMEQHDHLLCRVEKPFSNVTGICPVRWKQDAQYTLEYLIQ